MNLCLSRLISILSIPIMSIYTCDFLKKFYDSSIGYNNFGYLRVNMYVGSIYYIMILIIILYIYWFQCPALTWGSVKSSSRSIERRSSVRRSSSGRRGEFLHGEWLLWAKDFGYYNWLSRFTQRSTYSDLILTVSFVSILHVKYLPIY